MRSRAAKAHSGRSTNTNRVQVATMLHEMLLNNAPPANQMFAEEDVNRRASNEATRAAHEMHSKDRRSRAHKDRAHRDLVHGLHATMQPQHRGLSSGVPKETKAAARK